MSKKVFLSYANPDEPYVRALATALQRQGVSAITQTTDTSVDAGAGKRVALTVKEALAASSAVVVVLSEAAQVSPWVAFEVGHAVGQGKPIVVVGKARESGLHVLDQALSMERGDPEDVARRLRDALGAN
jgi:nucleoside 2-deoxyribosyltransferase